MNWIGGLDEAGYGPVLGPLVHGGVAARAKFRWQEIFSGQRVRIGDSKALYRGGKGLAGMETAVLLAGRLAGWTGDDFPSLVAFLINPERDCTDTACFQMPMGKKFPFFCDHIPQTASNKDFKLFARITFPKQFNELLSRMNKSALSMLRLGTIIRRMIELFGNNGAITVDKQGGRNFYSEYLFSLFDGDMAIPIVEGAEASTYRLAGDTRISFQRKADALSDETALASITAKYLREAYMLFFNSFWKTEIPEIKPTAGYPEDGARFFIEISHLLARKKLNKQEIYRIK